MVPPPDKARGTYHERPFRAPFRAAREGPLHERSALVRKPLPSPVSRFWTFRARSRHVEETSRRPGPRGHLDRRTRLRRGRLPRREVEAGAPARGVHRAAVARRAAVRRPRARPPAAARRSPSPRRATSSPSSAAAASSRRTSATTDIPTLARESHSRDPSAQARGGRTARRRPDDPRRATMNTLVAVTSRHAHRPHRDGPLRDHADRRQVHGRREALAQLRSHPGRHAAAHGHRDGTAPATATTPPPKACATPGEPARLEVRPSRKLMKTGETFAFHAVVLDAAGCAHLHGHDLERRAIRARRSPSTRAGNVTVARRRARGQRGHRRDGRRQEREGHRRGLPPAHYDELLASLGSTPPARATPRRPRSSPRARSAAATRRRRTADAGAGHIFIAIVGSLALVLGILALVGIRRSRRAARPRERGGGAPRGQDAHLRDRASTSRKPPTPSR